MSYAWAWEKLSGLQEFALRAGNAPWLLLGLGVVSLAIRKTQLCWGLLLIVLTSSFVWFYLDDARPYSVQIGCSLVVVASIYRLGTVTSIAEERSWLSALGVGSILLAASGMLAMIWLGAFLAAAILGTQVRTLKGMLARQRVILAGFSAAVLVIGFYYLWTLTLGARASAMAGTDLRNLLFIFYELLGFGGLGPGRLQIRNGGMRVFLPWLPLLAIYALSLASVLFLAFRELNRIPLRTRVWWGLTCLGALMLLIAIGVTVHFRVLARHCAPLGAVLWFVLAMGLSEAFQMKSHLAKVAAVLFLALSLISCLGIRFGDRHAKDDYRSAAALAKQALSAGKSVWWNADVQGALVYGVKASEEPNPEMALVITPSSEGFDKFPQPDLVVTSKGDVYDPRGALREFLERSGYRPQTGIVAFTIWRRGV